jgi:hypothetical protein
MVTHSCDVERVRGALAAWTWWRRMFVFWYSPFDPLNYLKMRKNELEERAVIVVSCPPRDFNPPILVQVNMQVDMQEESCRFVVRLVTILL